MKAIAVHPGKANSVHLRDIPKPAINDIPEGRGVLVKVLKVGVDATDSEINQALYGAAPQGDDYLVLGHECFGVVHEVGENVTHVKRGDYVTCTVRRPGSTIYDLIGTNDMTSDTTYFERGINLLHGYLTEYFVDDAEFIVKVPKGLKHLHVLFEPVSIAAKAVMQAYEAQRRLQVWKPQRAFVLGAGQIGLLTSMVLRLKGLDVYTLARSKAPMLKSEITAEMEATYVSTSETSIHELAKEVGAPDIIVEATGNSAIAFEAMQVLALNGVLIWTSVTGGNRTENVPTDKINLDWVLGNKLLVGTVNANANHFRMGIADLALAEVTYPGVVEKILTNPVKGLENYAELIRLLEEDRTALKVYMEVAEE